MRCEGALEIAARVEPARESGRFLDVEFAVPPGITMLVGPSGAGKTTTLAVIAGLVRPTSGRVRLGERTLFDARRGLWLPPHERRIALVFQAPALFPHLSVERNVSYGIPASVPRTERRRRAAEWLERMHALHVRERAVATLSGGEAQRVALARALASEPRALLLDEPFSALDGALRRELAREIREIADAIGIPTLVVSHDASDGRDLDARAIVIEAGRTLGLRHDPLSEPLFSRRSHASTTEPPRAPCNRESDARRA